MEVNHKLPAIGGGIILGGYFFVNGSTKVSAGAGDSDSEYNGWRGRNKNRQLLVQKSLTDLVAGPAYGANRAATPRTMQSKNPS